jgi:hypothetical protein
MNIFSTLKRYAHYDLPMNYIVEFPITIIFDLGRLMFIKAIHLNDEHYIWAF